MKPIPDAQVEAVARAICRETNAFYGEPPCWEMTDNWPEDACDEPGCIALARAACAAMARAVREVMGDQNSKDTGND